MANTEDRITGKYNQAQIERMIHILLITGRRPNGKMGHVRQNPITKTLVTEWQRLESK